MLIVTLCINIFTGCESRRPNVQNPIIKGWVKVQFTITKQGTVKSPVVLKSKPKGVFDKEALHAISKYKFKPLVNKKGKIVEKKAVQIIEFKIAN